MNAACCIPATTIRVPIKTGRIVAYSKNATTKSHILPGKYRCPESIQPSGSGGAPARESMCLRKRYKVNAQG